MGDGVTVGSGLLMYAPDITERVVKALNAAQGWDLVQHSQGQINAATSHFEDLIDEETKELKRALAPDEQRFIDNERLLSGIDYVYWRSRYARIIDWEKKNSAFVPNVAQRIVEDIWADLERAGRAIMMQQLKARQLGVTTETEIAVAHRVQFSSMTNAVIASADPKKSIKMADMVDFCWAQQPWWMLPKTTKVENGMPVEFGELNSSILIQAGNQFNGVARGQTPNVAHLSELCEWDDPANLVDAALLKAIHETPDVFVILESTALGRGNWWHDTWKQTKEDWPRGRSRLCPIFLPWYVGVDIYPTATDLRMRPIPPDWVPSDLTIRHAEQARAYVLSSPALFKHLAKFNKDWQMPRAQMWYYEIERDAAIKKKQLNLFLSEMPATDDEAFQSTNISAFDPQTILIHRSHVRHPIACYTIAGTGIPNDLVVESREWDLTQQPIFIKAADLLTKADRSKAASIAPSGVLLDPALEQEVFQLIPLKFEGYSSSSFGMKLYIYEWPQEGAEYGLGIDTGDGVGVDRSVVMGIRKNYPQAPDYQVCEFASPYIKALQLWPMALTIALLYSVFQPSKGRRTQCRVAIECRGNGESVQWEMLKRGWWNFHPWKKLDNKRPTTAAQTNKIGVFTSSWYRPLMMDRLMTMLEDETFLVWSPYVVDEMEALEKDETRQSMKAVYGEHDDRIMGLGFILDSLHVDDRPYGRTAYTKTARIGTEDPPPDRPQYASFKPGIQSQDLRFRDAHPFQSGRGNSPGRMMALRKRP